jgi:reactive intermediate/imine deaminase
MQRRVLNATKSAKNTAAVSPGVLVGDFLYTSGLGPQDPVTGATEGDIATQTRTTLEKIRSVLRDGGLDLADVVKTTVHLQDLSDFAAFDATYREFFSEPYPARTTVESGLLGILVEIDVVACARTGE